MRWAPSVVTVHREVIGEFLTLSQTNPQSAEDHIGDPGRQHMKGCRNHHQDSDQENQVGHSMRSLVGTMLAPFALTPFPIAPRLKPAAC